MCLELFGTSEQFVGELQEKFIKFGLVSFMDKKEKMKETKLSLGWLLFWFVVIPPVGYIWLFLEWIGGGKCVVKKR